MKVRTCKFIYTSLVRFRGSEYPDINLDMSLSNSSPFNLPCGFSRCRQLTFQQLLILFHVAKCNLGKVKKETMRVGGHIRKYVGGSQPLSESCQRGLSLTGLRALQGIVNLCSCLWVDPPTPYRRQGKYTFPLL